MVIKVFNLSATKKVKIAFALLTFCTANLLNGQEAIYSYFYRVYFRDKGDNPTGNYAPQDLFSTRAINRRLKAGISILDFRDIPVYPAYLNQISVSGFKLHCTSKWMNSALFKTESPADIDILLGLPFVSDVKIVKIPGKKTSFDDKLNFQTEQTYFPFNRPVTMVNGNPLHASGFDGNGILIAVLDGGFTNADQISSINSLRNRNGIKATYNFVANNEFVYSHSTHGTAVLSVLAGEIAGSIEGTAPGADFLLLRTEDVASEFPCEEDFWAAGAEYADSAGADIISSSLGYYNFDDPTLNYKYSDLDGNTAFVTRVADFAASKGIIVVNSAGNERTKTWKRIIFPSDGDSVIAVGAVDGNNYISTFSSAGTSADGRIKPDNVTMGVSVPVQTSISEVTRANGTSFSCPVLSGMIACLMQAVPEASNADIIYSLHSSADRYNSPDSLYGYGIPDMSDALSILKLLQYFLVENTDKETFAGPNPFTDDLEIAFRVTPDQLKLEIYTISGNLVAARNYPEFFGRTLKITELRTKEQGIYIIRIITGYGTFTHKVIKLKN
jgi:serine protease AprX